MFSAQKKPHRHQNGTKSLTHTNLHRQDYRQAVTVQSKALHKACSQTFSYRVAVNPTLDMQYKQHNLPALPILLKLAVQPSTRDSFQLHLKNQTPNIRFYQNTTTHGTLNPTDELIRKNERTNERTPNIGSSSDIP
jgi:hypothetical protein